MSHTALARTHRPRFFGEVSTQEHVSETLRRAVGSDRVGHAYLFCGPRGVGKTTLARVLAMALNCPNRAEDGEPCGECDDCRQIWSGTTSLDVVEIDAATNRGVEDARDLRQRAMYAPSEEGRFKVYIVDEAHMLTREAWNALLKILEEPPARVIFIFATTEPQKIEQTAAPIMSRCQRFDFRRLGLSDIVARLREVLDREGVEAGDEALHIIARKADGGMRDALSLTDQVLALAGDRIDPADVRRVLGVVEDDRFLELFDRLAEGDRGGLLDLVEALQDQGSDVVEFYYGLLDALRSLLRLRAGGVPTRIARERLADWRSRAERFDAADLVRMLGIAAELETAGSLRRTGQPAVLLELLLLRFSYMDRTLDLETLLRSLGGDEPPPPEPTGRRSSEPVPPPPTAGPAAPVEAPGEPSSPRGAPPADPSTEGGNISEHSRAETTTAALRTDASESPETPEPTRVPDNPGVEPVAAWRDLVHSGQGMPSGLGPFLRGAVVRERDPSTLEVMIPPGPAEERLRSSEYLDPLVRALSNRAGRPISLEIQVGSVEHAPDQEERISRDVVRRGLLEDLLEEEPALVPAVEILDLEFSD